MDKGAFPCGLGVVRDFLRTHDAESQADELARPETARAWMRSAGIDAEYSEATAERLRSLRDVLETNLLANAGHGDRQAAIAALAPFGDAVRLRIGFQGEVCLRPVDDGVEGFVARVMGAVYDAIREGAWLRLKLCREDTCAVPFYDESKNGSGVWCSMEVCGNRNKARRRRQRQLGGTPTAVRPSSERLASRQK